MKPLFYLILTILPVLSFGQFNDEDQRYLDSLNKVLKKPFLNKIDKADCYNSLGFFYRLHQEYDLSYEYHEKALEIFDAEYHEWGQGITHTYLGYTYMAEDLFRPALKHLEIGYKKFKSWGDYPNAVNNLLQIGFLYFNREDYEEARNYYDRSLEMAKKYKDKVGESNAYAAIGAIVQTQGDLPKAIEYYEKALAIDEEEKNVWGIAGNKLNIAWAAFEQGNYPMTINLADEALDIYYKMGNHFGMGNAYNLIGAGHKELGQYSKALHYLQKALDHYDEAGTDVSKGTIYNNMATVYFMQDDLPNSLRYHQKGLRLNESVNDDTGIALSLSNVGTVFYKMGQVDEGLDYLLRALEKSELLKNVRFIKLCKKQLFEIYDTKGNIEEAEQYIFDVLKMNEVSIAMNFPTLSESEKEKFFKSISEDYEEFNDFAFKRKDVDPEITGRVYNNILRNKGLLLKSSTAMRYAILGSSDTTLIRKYEAWIEMKTNISKAYANGEDTQNMEAEANVLEKELVKGSQEFQDLHRTHKMTWQEVKSKLNKEDAAIEFVHFNHYDSLWKKTDTVWYCALIVRHDSEFPEMVQLCTEKDLEQHLGKFGGNNLNYINGIYGTKEDPNIRLYELLWKPMESKLEGAKNIFLSPTGLLHRVSFSAISADANNYLCDQYNLRNLSSTGKVVMPESFSLVNTHEVTLFGGIDYNTEKSKRTIWSFLSGTKVEVESIDKILTKKDYKVNKATTETAFKEKANGSSVIHMSTHGFFYPDPEEVLTDVEIDTSESGEIAFRGGQGFGVMTFVKNKNPLMRSGLVLSGANEVWDNPSSDKKEDGVLTAFEVAQIDLRNTGLVVLSACETGLGDIKGSEGVYGLQRAFKMAGVKFIIMSLWQVPDKETQEFMTYFYEQLTATGDVRQSFTTTQKHFRKKYAPYFWAAFVLLE